MIGTTCDTITQSSVLVLGPLSSLHLVIADISNTLHHLSSIFSHSQRTSISSPVSPTTAEKEFHMQEKKNSTYNEKIKIVQSVWNEYNKCVHLSINNRSTFSAQMPGPSDGMPCASTPGSAPLDAANERTSSVTCWPCCLLCDIASSSCCVLHGEVYVSSVRKEQVSAEIYAVLH